MLFHSSGIIPVSASLIYKLRLFIVTGSSSDFNIISWFSSISESEFDDDTSFSLYSRDILFSFLDMLKFLINNFT